MAGVDIEAYIIELKDHLEEHGFHLDDSRHFIEMYSLQQLWEIDIHPKESCSGPLELHLSFEVDPKVLISFEEALLTSPGGQLPRGEFNINLSANWSLPPLKNGPDLLNLAIDLAGIGGTELPLEVSAIDSFSSPTDPPERKLSVVSNMLVALVDVYEGEELLCDFFDNAHEVSKYLLKNYDNWK